MVEVSTLEVMLRQEEKIYAVRGDFLGRRGNSALKIEVDYSNRESMIDWSYKVIDFLGFKHEMVEIAINYLENFLLTPTGSKALTCTKLFQLATMACLYLAIKIHADLVLDSKFMANLSQGLFSYNQVEEMEMHVLTALSWRVNPPTALAFVREFLDLLPSSVSQEMKKKAYTLCEPQIEVSVIDYNFVNVKASTVAHFAVMNALKVLAMDSVILSHINSLLSYASHIDHESVQQGIQDSLYEAVVEYSDIRGVSAKGCCLSPSQKECMFQRATYNESPCGVFS
jgi:hypothetical protein